MQDATLNLLPIEKTVEILFKYNIRPTAQRVEIARILLCKPQHLSADQVLSKANDQLPVVSKATVYNTLNLFVSKGLLRQVIVDSSKVFYDSNIFPHHHLYNEDTGIIDDIDAEQIQVSNLPELPEGTVNSGVDVIIRVKNKS